MLAPRLLVKGFQSDAAGGAYGFKLLSHHLTQVQHVSSPAAFLQHLDRAGYRVIHLVRRSQLRQILSNFYVSHRGGYAGGHQHHRSADGAPTVTQMTVDVDELAYWLLENERRAQSEQASLGSLPRLGLYYEDALQRSEDHQGTVDLVSDYIGVHSAPVRAGLSRCRPLTTWRTSSPNHDEVIRFLQRPA